MNNAIQFILYQLPYDEGKVQVVIKDETIWATQKAMAQLFDIDKSGISRHVANIFKEGELPQETMVAKIATVVNRGIKVHYSTFLQFSLLRSFLGLPLWSTLQFMIQLHLPNSFILNPTIKTAFSR
jgi:hypothetical protein